MSNGKRAPVRKVRPSLSFPGAQNESLFRRFTPFDEGVVATLEERLRSLAPGSSAQLDRLLRAGCPASPLVYRMFIVAYFYLDPRRSEQPSRLGGATTKEFKALGREAGFLADRIDKLNRKLFEAGAALYAGAGPRRRRMRELPELLRAHSEDLEAERVGRRAAPKVPDNPHPKALYLTGLCDFVRQQAGRDYFGSIGELLASAVAVLEGDTAADRKELTEEAVRKTVTRFRRRLLAGSRL